MAQSGNSAKHCVQPLIIRHRIRSRQQEGRHPGPGPWHLPAVQRQFTPGIIPGKRPPIMNARGTRTCFTHIVENAFIRKQNFLGQNGP